MGTTMETGLRHRVPQEIWTAVAIFAKFSRDMREGGHFVWLVHCPEGYVDIQTVWG